MNPMDALGMSYFEVMSAIDMDLGTCLPDTDEEAM